MIELASELDLSKTNDEASRRANAARIRELCASETPIMWDGEYHIQRVLPDENEDVANDLTGSMLWHGEPGLSRIVMHGTGSEIRLFEPSSMDLVLMRGIGLRANDITENRSYRLLSTSGTGNIDTLDIRGCTFRNCSLARFEHDKSDEGQRGFRILRMLDCDITDLYNVSFLRADAVPWELVELDGIRSERILQDLFYFWGTFPTLSGPVYFRNMRCVNPVDWVKPAINSGSYFDQGFAARCVLSVAENCYTEGLSSYRTSSAAHDFTLRGQQVIARNNTQKNCVTFADNRNALINGKFGYTQEDADGLELTREYENVTTIVDDSYMRHHLGDDYLDTWWQSPWHMPDDINAREGNSFSIINCHWRVPHLHLRYFWSTPGNLVFRGNTIDCQRIARQLTAGLFTLEAGPKMKRLDIDGNTLIARGAATDYPLITFRYDPGPAVKITAYNNKLDGCLTQDNQLEPAPAVQPLAVYQFEVEGSQMVTKADFEMFKGANLDAPLPGSMPSGERTVRFRATTRFGDPDSISLDALEWTASSVRIVMDAAETAEIETGRAGFTRMFYRVESVGSDPDDVVRTHYGEVRVNA